MFLKKKGFDIVGVDISKEALNKLKNNSEKLKLKTDFYKANAEKLPFKDKSFNVVYSINTLNFTDIKKIN